MSLLISSSFRSEHAPSSPYRLCCICCFVDSVILCLQTIEQIADIALQGIHGRWGLHLREFLFVGIEVDLAFEMNL